MAMNAVWASVAPGWEQHADFIDERALPFKPVQPGAFSTFRFDGRETHAP